MKNQTHTIRVVFTVLALLMVAFTINARRLSPEQAMDRAITQLTLPVANPTGNGPLRAFASQPVSCVYTSDVTTESGSTPAFYVFNIGTDNGFVITGADDSVRPVLGICDNGSFDPNNLPPQMEWWLGEYAAQIEYYYNHSDPDTYTLSAAQLQRLNAPVPAQPKTARTPITPMVSTKWDQGSPYNNQCPTKGGSRTYTGCVATAMAQIMYYHQWPVTGTGTHSYTWNNTTVSFDYASTTFEWDKMNKAYTSGGYTTAQATAVATLMKACGVAVDMNYGTAADGGSGAVSADVVSGVTSYMRYSDKTTYYGRAGLSVEQWTTLVYDALAAGYPLYYAGSGSAGGHAFVCDGYSSDGLFHFNWGWSGSGPDGYYALDALDPPSLGAGGGAGGFNSGQEIIVLVRPDQSGYTPAEGINPAALYTDQFKVSGSNTSPRISFNIFNNTAGTVNFRLWGRITDANGKTLSETQTYTNDLELPTGAYFPSDNMYVNPSVSSLTKYGDGTFRYYVGYKTFITSTQMSEYRNLPAEQGGDYMEYVVSNGKITSKKVGEGSETQQAALYFRSFNCPTPMYIGKDNKVSAVVENSGDAAYKGILCLALITQSGEVTYIRPFNENPDYSVSIAAGSSSTFSFTETLVDEDEALEPGKYYACLLEVDLNVGSATLADDTLYPVTVKEYSDQPVTSIEAWSELTELKAGQNVIINVKIEPSDAANLEVSFKSNSPSLTVNDMGIVKVSDTPVLGPASITVTALGGENISADVNFDIIATLVEEVTLSAPAETLSAGGSLQIQAAVLPVLATDKSLTYTTDYPGITVSDNGLVTAADDVKSGTALITATANDGSGITASIEIGVTGSSVIEVTGISAVADATEVRAGQTATISVTLEPADPTDSSVTFATDSPSLTVSADGVVTVSPAPELGTATVTVTALGGTDISTVVTFEIVATPVESITLTGPATSLSAGSSIVIEANVLPALATDKSLTWTTDYAGLTVSANGTVTASDDVVPGMALVTATANDGSGVTGSIEIAVENTNAISTVGSDKTDISVASLCVTVSGLTPGTTAELIDICGRTVATGTAVNGRVQLNAAAHGIYIVRVGTITARVRL